MKEFHRNKQRPKDAVKPFETTITVLHPTTRTAMKHPLEPVWNERSRVLILGTMPSPKSREAGFYYMHPQNRFWRVLPQVFGEQLSRANNDSDREGAVKERRDFLLRHKIALWDVLFSCDIQGAADASIKNAVPNDFHKIFARSKIKRVFCAGKTAFSLWNKFCAAQYERRHHLTVECLPSPSPANASWSLERLAKEYARIAE